MQQQHDNTNSQQKSNILLKTQSNQFQETTPTLDSPNNFMSTNKFKSSEMNQEVTGFHESLMQLKSFQGKKQYEDEDELDQRIHSVQQQIDISKAENNKRIKKELMRKGTINISDCPSPVNDQENQQKSKLNKSILGKLRGIISIDKMKKVQPQKKLTAEEIKKKWQKAMMIIKTVVRLNKISENIRNYGTSYNLFDVATRDRPTVKKVLFPLTTLNDEQIEQELSESLPFPLVHPDSKINKIWNPIYLILMLYIATVMPYRIAFEDSDIPQEWIIIDYFTDSMFWIDLIINLITAYYNEDGQLVTSRALVFWNYGKSWFIIDFLACFPFELAITGQYHNDSTTDNTIKLVKLSRIPRMYRLVRITKVVKLFKVLDKTSFLDFLQFNTGILRLISLFMTVLLFVHLMGCFWFYIANDESEEENWVDRSGMRDETNYSIYIASIYYSFTALTTVGYGDITARTNLEMIVTMFWMVFGVGFYSFTIGILSSVLAHMDTKSTNLQKKISIMNEFCNEMKISKDLKQKLRKALTFNSDKNCFSWADQQNIFRQLPINLRYEICTNIHQGVMKTFNFFTMEDDKYFVTRIVPILKPLHMEEGEILWEEGWNPESIYLLSQGRINFMKYIKVDSNQPNSKFKNIYKNKPVKFKSMINGSYFGEIDIIKNRKRQFNAVCDSECELYYLPRFEYENIIRMDFPHIDEKLRTIAQERDKKNDEALEAIKKILKDPKNQTEDDINIQITRNSQSQTMLQKLQQKGRLSLEQSNKRGTQNDLNNVILEMQKTKKNSKENLNTNHISNLQQQKQNTNQEQDNKKNIQLSSSSQQSSNDDTSSNGSESQQFQNRQQQSDNSSQDNSSSYYSSQEDSVSNLESDENELSDAESYVSQDYSHQAKQDVQNMKEEIMKYQKKAQIIENKFSQLETTLGSTLEKLKKFNSNNNNQEQ